MKTFGIIVLVLVVSFGAFWWIQSSGQFEKEGDTQTNQNDSVNEEEQNTSSSIPAEWNTYTNENFTFTFRYPEEAETSVEAGRVKVQLIGPDSEPATEITDGFTATIEKNALTNDQTFEGFVQGRYDEEVQSASEGEGPEETVIAGRSGQVFVTESELGGNVSFVFLEGESDVVYEATYSVSDPNNIEYEQMIRAMLGTLKATTDSEGANANTVSQVDIALLDRDLGSNETPDRGCDKVVMTTRNITPTQAPLTAALNELFSLQNEDVSGFYNYIARTNETLTFDSAVVNNGTAEIYLQGSLSGLAGVCDNPRAAIQIEETALQFSTVNDVEFFLNGQPDDLMPNASGA